MIRYLVLLCLMCFSNICTAGGWDTWDDKTKAMFVASNVAIVADWGTTRDIAKRPNEFKEVGPIARATIGEHPTTQGVDLYMIIRLAANYLIATNIDEEYRFMYLTVTTVEHGLAAYSNMRIGLRINF